MLILVCERNLEINSHSVLWLYSALLLRTNVHINRTVVLTDRCILHVRFCVVDVTITDTFSFCLNGFLLEVTLDLAGYLTENLWHNLSRFLQDRIVLLAKSAKINTQT